MSKDKRMWNAFLKLNKYITKEVLFRVSIGSLKFLVFLSTESGTETWRFFN
jgi:hypothetical protein